MTVLAECLQSDPSGENCGSRLGTMRALVALMKLRPGVLRRGGSGLLAIVLLCFWGCASAPAPRPTAHPFDDVRRLAIIASGESSFSIVGHHAEPGRTFDEILAWYPTQAWMRPLAKLLHRGINWALELDQTATISRRVDDIAPRAIVAAAMAQKLRASGWFDEVRTLEREPTAEERRADPIVRVMVPAWGLVRVHEGDPDLLASFADVRGYLMIPGTGVVLWEGNEDVTAPEQFPGDSFMKDHDFARQEVVDVLERAGQRLASELMYARSAGR